MCVGGVRLFLEDNFQFNVKKCFFFPSELEHAGSHELSVSGGVPVGMPTWLDGYQERLNGPQGFCKIPPHTPMKSLAGEPGRGWEAPLPLRGTMQPFPARVGSLGFCAAAGPGGLFGSAG